MIGYTVHYNANSDADDMCIQDTPTEVTVNYKCDSEAGTTHTDTVSYGSEYAPLENASPLGCNKTGYAFTGWHDENDVAYTGGNITSDITLIAQWVLDDPSAPTVDNPWPYGDSCSAGQHFEVGCNGSINETSYPNYTNVFTMKDTNNGINGISISVEYRQRANTQECECRITEYDGITATNPDGWVNFGQLSWTTNTVNGPVCTLRNWQTGLCRTTCANAFQTSDLTCGPTSLEKAQKRNELILNSGVPFNNDGPGLCFGECIDNSVTIIYDTQRDGNSTDCSLDTPQTVTYANGETITLGTCGNEGNYRFAGWECSGDGCGAIDNSNPSAPTMTNPAMSYNNRNLGTSIPYTV